MLKQAMADGQVSVNNIANHTYRSVSTVRRWLNNTQSPGKSTVKALGIYLKNDAYYFLQDGVVFPNGLSRF